MAPASQGPVSPTYLATEEPALIDVIRDIILAAAGVLVLIVLNRSNSQQRSVPRTVWPFVLSGFALLLTGRVLEMMDPGTLGVPILVKGLVQEVLGFCLGFVLLTTGLVRWLPEVTGKPRPAARPAAPPPARVQPVEVTAGTEHSAHEMLISVLKSSLSGVMVFKAIRDDGNDILDFEVVLMNDAAQQILGRPSTSLVGKGVLKEFACIRQENLLGHMVSVIETGLPFRNERQFNHDRNGRWYQFVAVKLSDGLAVTFADTSDRKRAEQQLRHAAHHDTLTGLPNRALFTERLGQAVNRAKRFPDYKFAVLFLDFDRFKLVNDTLGHEAGDLLLTGISERLRSNLRSIDTPAHIGEGEHLPARLGGDEFVIILENIQGVEDAVRVAERLQVELSAPHDLSGHEAVSTASIGIVCSDLGYDSADDILRDADMAMYQAKMAGKARHVVFDKTMHEEVVGRANRQKELREAAEKMAFELRFDPIVDLESGLLSGFEVRTCWPHPERGTLSGSEFLGLAEDLGLTVPIGEWALRAACRHLQTWRERFPGRPLGLHVNLSKQHLHHPDLVPLVERLVAETGLVAGTLRLEITESAIMEDADGSIEIMKKLDRAGVRFVVDEFGTAHSSLACLHSFPVDLLKIDRDFISAVRRRRDYGAIVNAVVELAHNLDMKVVADGVETPDQLALLQALECDFAQGALFAEPVDLEAAERMVVADERFAVAAA